MKQSLRILIVEDEEDDALLIVRHLRREGLEIEFARVTDAREMREALDAKMWDAVTCDHNLPGFNPYSAMQLLRKKGLDMPFIVISGRIPEDILIGLMKAGAHDVILKSNLARLVPAIEREVSDAQERRKQRRTEQLLQEAIESVDHGFAIYDAEDRLVLANSQYTRLYAEMHDIIIPGMPADDLLREGVKRGVFILHGQDADQFVQEQKERRGPALTLRELELTGGRWLKVSERRTSNNHLVSVVADETEQKNRVRQIERAASQDPLTGLANRKTHRANLKSALNQARRTGRLVGVLLLDLDRFKFVNDTFGHAAGDEVIRIASARLQDCVRVSDSVARLGGDEFAIIATNNESIEGIASLAHRVVRKFAEPFVVENNGIFLGASVGISTYPQDSKDIDELVRNADVALYRAKERGRGTYEFFDAEMDRQIREKRALETDLRMALQRGEIELHYQPRLDLKTLKFIGLEAFMRWRHSERGMVPPAEFVPLAEESNLILELSDWVLTEAIKKAVAFQECGLPPMIMSVNVAPLQLRQANWVRQVGRTLRDAGLPPDLLELELSERGTVFGGPELISKLVRLKKLGIRLAIHNFGTGYSSLKHMRELPTDIIKIDRSFVQGADNLWEDTATCATIVRLAHGLQMKVVAEGVEKGTQLAAVAELGCDQAQGFYLAPPMAEKDLVAFLRACNASWSDQNLRSASISA